MPVCRFATASGLFRRLPIVGSLLVLAAFPIPAHDLPADHNARFQFSEAFIKNVWHYPIQTLGVSMECPAEATNTRQAGPVHSAATDCEIHVGAALLDASVSDFQFTVLEPPNICHDEESEDVWRERMDNVHGSTCEARGFLRVWPEHLGVSEHCSNPGHVLEVHPLLRLTCNNGTPMEFLDMLYVPDDLGYKPPDRVREMMSMHLWLRRDGLMPGGANTVSFDYGYGSNHKRSPVSNFGRLRVRILPEFIRKSTDANGASRGFATVIARVLPVNTNGQSDTAQWEIFKIYAIEGTPFFTNLMAREGTTGAGDEFDIVGIFTFDPLSIIKVTENPETPVGEGVAVPFPVSFIAFGERQ